MLKQSLTLTGTIARSAKLASDSPQAKELNRAVAYHTAKDSVPISTAEKPGFKQLVSKLNPQYQMPSRCHFTNYEISQLYSQVKENVVAASLNNVLSFPATTQVLPASHTKQ